MLSCFILAEALSGDACPIVFNITRDYFGTPGEPKYSAYCAMLFRVFGNYVSNTRGFFSCNAILDSKMHVNSVWFGATTGH